MAIKGTHLIPYGDLPTTAKEERYGDQGERASLRVILRTVQVRLESGYVENRVVAVEMPEKMQPDFRFPPPKVMTCWDVSDWHGQASLPLPADMPEEEQLRRVAVAKTIHGPNSMESCCVRKRQQLAAQQGAP